MNSKDIAKLAGVSRSTVSRVINNYKNVPEKTRKRILNIIEENNYVPHAGARLLAGAKNKTIGIVLVDKKNNTRGKMVTMSSFFMPFMSGAIDCANQKNYNVMVFTIAESCQLKRVQEVIYNSTISGCIFLGQQNDDIINDIVKSKFKTVQIDKKFSSNDMSITNNIIVNADNFRGAFDITEYLIKLGHKKIAHITGYSSQLSTTDRLNGYKAALKKHSIPIDENLIVSGDFMREGGYLATKNLFAKSRPTAIFYANDSMALGGLGALDELGLSVPDDISIVGFDDIELSSFSHPPLTTVHMPVSLMSSTAVEILINSIENNNNDCECHVIPVDLLVRKSCKKV